MRACDDRAHRRWPRAALVITAAGTAVFGLAAMGAGMAAASATATATATARTWLQEINYYRVGAGLKPVTDDRAWDRGIVNHLRYLAKTPARYRTGKYADEHLENPKSPYYTKSGALEASRSDLLQGAAGSLGDIDVWLGAPFHAIGMLRSALTKVAFAARYGYAGLDVIGGLGYAKPDPKAILFPGNHVTTNLTSFGGELPNPLQSCHFTRAAHRKPVGLPLIALLPATPSRTLTAQLAWPGGHVEGTKASTLCMVDQYTYHSTDKIYGPTGKQILIFDHAVLLFPSGTLTSGSYRATIHDGTKASYTWTFKVKA
jgi:hypothetical protein